MRANYLWLCPILLVGGFFRWHDLGVQSLWLDEAYSLGLTRVGWAGVWGAMLAVSDTSPLYYVVLRLAVPVFGSSEFGLRAFSVFTGWLALTAAYRAGRILVGESSGVVATGFLAVSPFAVWYSQDARPYGVYLLLAGLSLWGFWRAWRSRGWGLFVASSALLYLTHYAAALFVYAQLGWLIVELRRRPAFLRRWMLAQVIAAIPVGVWLALFLARRQPVTANTWIPNSSILAPLQTLANFVGGDAAEANVTTVGLGLIVLALVGLGLARFDAAKRLLAWWLFFPIVALTVLSYRLPAYVDRFLEPTILAAAMLIAAGLFSLPQLWRTAALILLVGFMCWSTGRLYYDAEYAKEDWRGASALLADVRLPIGLPDPESNLGILPYAPPGAVFILARDETELGEAAQAGRFALILRSPHESNHALTKSAAFDPLTEGPAFFRDWVSEHPAEAVKVHPFVGLAIVEIGD